MGRGGGGDHEVSHFAMRLIAIASAFSIFALILTMLLSCYSQTVIPFILRFKFIILAGCEAQGQGVRITWWEAKA